MLIDENTILAQAESVPDSGDGGLGEYSVDTLGLDLGKAHDFGLTRDEIGTAPLELAIDVTTSFTEGVNVELEIQLVSLPVDPTKLADGTAGAADGKLLSIASQTIDDADDLIDLANHGLPLGTPFYITGGSGGSGFANNTIYYAVPTASGSFEAATTLENALAGTTVDQTGADYTGAVIHFIPFVHASTGGIPAPFLQAGNRFVARTMPWAVGPTGKMALPTGQTVEQPLGAGPGPMPVAGRYLALRYKTSATMSSGAINAHLCINAGGNYRYGPTALKIQ